MVLCADPLRVEPWLPIPLYLSWLSPPDFQIWFKPCYFQSQMYWGLYSQCRSPGQRWRMGACTVWDLNPSAPRGGSRSLWYPSHLWVTARRFWFPVMSLPLLLFSVFPFLYIFSCGRALLPVFRLFSVWVAIYVSVALLCPWVGMSSGYSYSTIFPWV